MKNGLFVCEMGRTKEQVDSPNEDKKSKMEVRQRLSIIISIGLCIFMVMSVVVYRQKRRLRGIQRFVRQQQWHSEEYQLNQKLSELVQKMHSVKKGQ